MFQVEELRRDLRIKSQELEVKNAAANDKLKKMVKDQQEAEKKKVSFHFRICSPREPAFQSPRRVGTATEVAFGV